MDAKVRNKICSSESLDNREKMFKSRRTVLLLNIMPVSYTHLTLPTNREV